ncbi:MAG: LPS-assembly protein LptD [Bacteroidota bacterium]|nr:LPS-assembly protein LptD [Bacteroidota bacterium]
MQNRNEIRSKNILPFTLTAFLFVFLYSAVKSSDLSSNKDYFFSGLNNPPSELFSSKENHFSVAKKQKLINDSIPSKNNNDTDSIPNKNPDSLLLKDSSANSKTADTIHYNLAKNALEAPVEYSAEDSMVVDVKGKTVTLYGNKVTTNYKGNKLTGPIISFDETSGDIIAAIKRDSTGKVIAYPTYKSSDFTSQSDSIRFNMKTGKGLTKGTYTQQGEMYVYGQVIKKVSPDVFYALRGRFTTCNLDTPHFAFIANKIKFITNKVAISGPVHPEFEGVPIPIYFPFGIFPLNQGRHSGFLSPNFTVNQQKGLGLEGIGYYKVINDYWDIVARADIYSYGGWSLNLNPRYSKKYHYSGNFSLDIQHFNLNFKGDPDFQKNKSFHITWSHSADTKSRPGVTFSANVNAGSSSFNQQVPNNPVVNFQNQLTSSISYSKRWQDLPFNLTLTANHDQNTNLKLINISLPTLGFNMTTIYPFRKKDAVGDLKWYENIGIGYNLNAGNRFSFSDSVGHPSIIQQIRDTLQWGVHHSLPISLSLPQMGVFQLSPSVSYDETWYQSKVTNTWDSADNKLVPTVQKGFYTARQMSFGLSVSTRIFGMITAKNKNAKIQAIRHELRPTIGISYQPNFNRNNYYSVVVDSFGNKDIMPYFPNNYNLYGPYNNGRFGGFTFGLENNLSMKVRDKKDTGNVLKKVSLIDAFSINGSYNFFPVDFRHFSNLSAVASTNLFNKINFTSSANFDPYEVNSEGRDTSILIWKRNPISLGRMMNANISLSSSFKGGNKKTGEKAGVKPDENAAAEAGYSQDQYNSDLAYIRNNPGEFADFNIPWSVNLSYALSYSKQFDLKKKDFKGSFTQYMNFGGTLAITPKWQMGVNGYYNISQGKINPLTLSISRDLHCWQMSINVTPLGIYRYYSINLSPKSPILRDLKVNRTRSFYNGL